MNKIEVLHQCPACRVKFAENGENFPFCSERCRVLDLGAWAAEKYTIDGGTNADDTGSYSDVGAHEEM